LHGIRAFKTSGAFVDTNVPVYLFDTDSPSKQQRSRALLEARDQRLVISTQVLQEFHVTVTRRLGRPLPEEEAEAATRELASLDMVDVDSDLVPRSISAFAAAPTLLVGRAHRGGPQRSAAATCC
jgi:predicted nucleic acid-binding protein